MELDELFRYYADPYELAVALVKVYGTRPELLAAAGQRWVQTFNDPATRAPRKDRLGYDGVDEAQWKLLGALPVADEAPEFDPFRGLMLAARREFTPPDFAESRRVSWRSELIDAAVALAPVRYELARWPDVLRRVVHHRSDMDVFQLAGHLLVEMPDLAYALLDEALVRPEPSPQTNAFRRSKPLFSTYPERGGTTRALGWRSTGSTSCRAWRSARGRRT